MLKIKARFYSFIEITKSYYQLHNQLVEPN